MADGSTQGKPRWFTLDAILGEEASDLEAAEAAPAREGATWQRIGTGSS
jgi:hypothetical protein